MKVGELLYTVTVDGGDSAKEIEKVKAGFGKIQDFAMGASAAITGLVAGILGMANASVNHAVEIDNLAKKLNLSNKEVQRQKLLFEQNNMSLSDMESTLGGVQEKIVESAKTGKNAFAFLNIDPTGKKPTQVMDQILAQWGKLDEQQKRVTASMLGIPYEKLAKLYGAKVDTKGMIDSDATVNALNDIGTEMTKLKEVSETTMDTFIADLAPVIVPLMKDFINWLRTLQDQLPLIASKIKEWLPFLLKVGEYLMIFVVATKALGTFGGMLFSWGTALKSLWMWFIRLIPAAAGFGTTVAVALGVIGAVLAVGFALFEAYKNNFLGFGDIVDSIGAKFQKWFVDLWNDIKSVFSDIGSLMQGAMELNPDKIMKGLKKLGTDFYTFMNDLLLGLPDMIIGVFKNVLDGFILEAKGNLGWLLNKIPGYSDTEDKGGSATKPVTAPTTSPAMTSSGPANNTSVVNNSSNSSKNVTVYANVSSNDPKAFVDGMDKYGNKQISKASGEDS